MSTIGQLLALAADPGIKPWDEIVQSSTKTKTDLMTLAELKAKQQAEQTVFEQIKNDPAVAQQLLGGGAVLGSLQQPQGQAGAGPMTQQTVMPGQPPGAPQPVPGGQDLSRFATQGAPGQSIIGSLGPAGQPQMQAPRNPALEMAATNPRAALMLQQQMQGQQDLALRRDAQRLTMGAKIAEAVGREAQAATDQASWDRARANVAQFNPQAAAQMQAVYSPEAKAEFVKRAVGVKDSADLQLRTMHEQTEQGKLQVQLAQAGYQGLGEGVTSILRGLSEEQVKQFGGRTTPAAVAYATEQGRKLAALSPAIKTELEIMKVNPLEAKPEQLEQAQKNIQDRELGKAGEAERLKFELEEKQRATLPLQDARKEDQDRFVYKGTGETVPGIIPYGEVRTLQGEKDPNKAVVHLTPDSQKQLTNLKQLEPVMQQYSELIQYAYGPGGPMEGYTRSLIPTSQLGAMWRQAMQSDPKLEAMRRSLQGQLQSVVRGLGARGDLNEAELKAATEMIANFDASAGLGLSLGPMAGSSGFGLGGSIKPSLSVPDTPQVGLELANNLIGTVNKRIGSILQNEQYAKTPHITLGRAGQPTGGAPQVPPGSLPPPSSTGAVPPRTWGIAPPATPGQPTPPAPAPTAPTAQPTSQGAPAPAPAPSSPAARQAPGKQSQARPGRRAVELARASGHKVMDRADVMEAAEQTGKSPQEIVQAARARGWTVYGGTALA